MNFQKVLGTPQFFLTNFIWIRALATVSRTFCRPHRPKVVRDRQSLTIVCDQLLDDDVVDIWNRAVATVSCTFRQPHLQKVVRSYHFFFAISMWKRALPTVQSRAHFVDHFPDRAAQPRKQRPSSGNHGQPLYLKKSQGFAPESVFSREFTHSRSLTLPNYLMMMRLTWWCGWHDDWDDGGCHDGETASHWQTSVTRKFPN